MGSTYLSTAVHHPPNEYPLLFPYPYSLDPLPSYLRNALIGVSFLALISWITTLVLVVFIIYRIIFWKRYYSVSIGHNQYILLIFQLLLADFQQATAFLISMHWIQVNRIVAPTPACSAQGWLVQFGDLSSGLWVLTIAIHTYYTIILGKKMEHKPFILMTVSIWLFCLVLSVIGPAVHPKDYFVRAGAWCWASDKYEGMRLGLHYIWIFMAQFGTIVVYAAVYIMLQRRVKASTGPLNLDGNLSNKKISRIAKYMTIYPVKYLICSLPLAAGRMSAMTGREPSMRYYSFAGALMTSSGFIDVLLYTLTRNVVVTTNNSKRMRSFSMMLSRNPMKGREKLGSDSPSDDQDRMRDSMYGNSTTISGLRGSRILDIPDISALGKSDIEVKKETSVVVTRELNPDGEENGEGSNGKRSASIRSGKSGLSKTSVEKPTLNPFAHWKQ
jgi:G protein-coupled glucose receptor regulating Gpa2/G protein-coupled glucose receptor regulating Gpa2 C-term